MDLSAVMKWIFSISCLAVGFHSHTYNYLLIWSCDTSPCHQDVCM